MVGQVCLRSSAKFLGLKSQDKTPGSPEMALARIISRSEACSRELAILLQSRGYAVETVSPDNVPSNAADLELRVDTDSGDRLTASVIARDGERSSTLEFVRQLKSPITAPIAAEFPAAPVEILAGPVVKSLSDRLVSAQGDKYAENVLPEPPRQAPLSGLQPVSDFTSASSQIVSPVTPALTRWRPIRPVGVQSSPPPRIKLGVADTKPIVVPAVSTPVPTVPATEPGVPIVASANPAAPIEEVGPVVTDAFPYQTFNRAPSLFGNVALFLTSTALLITLVVGFSLYRSKKSLSSTDKVAPSSATAASDVKDANHSAAGSPATRPPSKGAPSVKPATKSAPAGKPEPATKGVGEIKESNRGSLTASHRVRHSGGGDDDLVAKDTVVYLDRRAQPGASKPSTSNSRSRSHRDGAIAKNTVTYLNGMNGASKAAK